MDASVIAAQCSSTLGFETGIMKTEARKIKKGRTGHW
jgi:hypothetical protein